MDEYNTKVYLFESPYENPMELDAETTETNGVAFIFHCYDGEVITVPIDNLMLIEHQPDGYYTDEEKESEAS